MTASNVLKIRTPEGVVFSQLLAGPVIRFAAWLIDLMAIAAAISVLSTLLNLLSLISRDVAEAGIFIAYFILSIGYGMACEWLWRGQTLGKRLFRLRVVDAEGFRLQFSQVVMRNLLRFVDMLPMCYFIGGLSCWFSKKNQRLGDLAANTVVVRLPKIAEPDIDQLLPDKYNSLRQHPHLEARLRQQITPSEATLIVQALLRRDDFDPAARIELFAELAAHFRNKVIFPPESVEGVSDEQYLRNVADIVFRDRRATASASHQSSPAQQDPAQSTAATPS